MVWLGMPRRGWLAGRPGTESRFRRWFVTAGEGWKEFGKFSLKGRTDAETAIVGGRIEFSKSGSR
jgi:hypothetical protein